MTIAIVVLLVSFVALFLAAIPFIFNHQPKVNPPKGISWKDVLTNRDKTRKGEPRCYKEAA